MSRKPRINHVAMSVPADLLDDAHRAEILEFYGDVLGWEEHPSETVDRTKLVLRVHSHEQFVFLIAADDPMRCPPMDHFGLSVDTVEELEAAHARARAWAERDRRVEVIDLKADDFGPLVLSSFYLRFLFPMMIEVQHFDWHL